MNIPFIDLHVHSTFSDGTDTPSEIVRKASLVPLAALAITDHDTLDGLEEGESAARLRNIPFVRGCEISTMSEWGELHLLGLWIPKASPEVEKLKNALNDIRIKRMERNLRIAEKLRNLGFDIHYEDVAALAGGKVVGRPHFAALLMKMGIVGSIKEAFHSYLAKGGKAYEPRELMTPEKAVSLLKNAGAVVSFAHPRLMKASFDELDTLTRRLLPYGLDAIEAYHSEHNAGDVRECVELATRHHLLLTGGSDYHGANKPALSLGRGKGGLRVSKKIYDDLMEYRVRHDLD